MRKIIALIFLAILLWGITKPVSRIPFGTNKIKVAEHYITKDITETGAANVVTSVVVLYRGFDTLGEVTILFIAAIGLASILYLPRKKVSDEVLEESSLILRTGCRFLFPLILLFGAYIFVHGHLTPGGGFQGGAIIASGFALIFLSCRERVVSTVKLGVVESLAGMTFVAVGLIGLATGGYFLLSFLPKGTLNMLFSAGIIPVIYVAVGFKVGSELAGIIGNLMERTQ